MHTHTRPTGCSQVKRKSQSLLRSLTFDHLILNEWASANRRSGLSIEVLEGDEKSEKSNCVNQNSSSELVGCLTKSFVTWAAPIMGKICKRRWLGGCFQIKKIKQRSTKRAGTGEAQRRSANGAGEVGGRIALRNLVVPSRKEKPCP